MLGSICLKSTIAHTIVLLQAMKISAINKCKKLLNNSAPLQISKLFNKENENSFLKETIKMLKEQQLPYLILASQSIKKLYYFQKQKSFYIAQSLHKNNAMLHKDKCEMLDLSGCSSIFFSKFAPIVFNLTHTFSRGFMLNQEDDEFKGSPRSNHFVHDDVICSENYQLKYPTITRNECPRTTETKIESETEDKQQTTSNYPRESCYDKLRNIVQKHKCFVYNLIDYIFTQYNNLIVYGILLNDSAKLSDDQETCQEEKNENNEDSTSNTANKQISKILTSQKYMELQPTSPHSTNINHLYIFSAVLTFIIFSLRLLRFPTLL